MSDRFPTVPPLPPGEAEKHVGAASPWRRLRHDLRTPVNHVLGYADMLLEEPEALATPVLLDGVRDIRVAGRQILTVIDQAFDAAGEQGVPDGRALNESLRTPVSTILGRCHHLKAQAEADQNSQLASDLRKIEASALRLAELAGALLKPGEAAALALAAMRTASATPPPPPPVVAAQPEPTATHHGAILVADDDRFNRELLARRLERMGHWVLLAENGKQALELARQVPLDMMLLDLVMPELDGYQTLERLKADKQLRHLPVVVLSSLHELSGSVRCIEMGAEDFLPKPVDDVLLRARIGATLEKKRLRDQEILHQQQIEHERARADALLHAIFPDEIARELKAQNRVEPRRHDNVAVLFADIVGFTPYCETHPAHEVVAQLQALTEAYEDIAQRHGVLKIKTIGDAFMAAAGLLRKPSEQPVVSCIRTGIEMIATARRLPPGWSVRVGIHAGPVVAGVLGRRQYLFDLWGDTVNTAARVQAYGTPNTIALTRGACEQAKGLATFQSLGTLKVKGKGAMEIFRFIELTDTRGAR